MRLVCFGGTDGIIRLIQNQLFVHLCVVFFIFVVLLCAWCKWLHFICRSLTATSSPQRSLVSQRFVSIAQGLSGDSRKDSSVKVINKNVSPDLFLER